MPSIGRLYVEVGGETKQLNASMKQALDTLKKSEVQATNYGKRFIATFNNALNPTKELTAKVKLLQKAGKTNAEIYSVMGTEIKQAMKTAKANAQQVPPELQKIVTEGKKAEGVFGRMATNADKMKSIGRTLSIGVTAPLLAAGVGALKLAGDFEQTTIAFTTMLGSQEKSSAFLKDLEGFAARTPFEFPDLLEASKRMMALGFEADQVIPSMTAIGDAVAGLGGGSELINRVTLALGQMQAKGKVSAEEMRQLAEAGIPAWDMLADKIGVSVPEAMKLAQKGAIQASQALPAILGGMNEKFGGLMAQQSQTLLGQISNMKDELFFTLRDLGMELIPIATNVVDKFVKPLLSGLKRMAEWFGNLSPPMQTIIVALGAVAAAAGPVLMAIGAMIPAVTALAPAFVALWGAITGPIGIVVGAIVGVGAALTALYKKNETFRKFIDKVWAGIKNIFTKSVNWIIKQLNKLPGINIKLIQSTENLKDEIEDMSGAMDDSADAMVTAGDVAQYDFGPAISTATGKVKDMTAELEDGIEGMSGFTQRAIDAKREMDYMGEAAQWLLDDMNKFKSGILGVTDEIEEMTNSIRKASAGKKDLDDDFLRPIPLDLTQFNYSKSQIEEAFERIKGKSKETGGAITQHISTTFTNMAQGLAENVIEWKGWKDTLIGTVKELAKGLLAAMIEGFVNKLADKIIDIVGGALKSLADYIPGLGGLIGGVTSGGTQAPGGAGGGGTEGTGGGGAGGFWGMMSGIGSMISAGLDIAKLFGPNYEKHMVMNLINILGAQMVTTGAVWTVNETLWTLVSKVHTNTISITAKQWIAIDHLKAITRKLSTINESILGVPALQSGTTYVPRSGLYRLHQGEQVVPAQHAARPSLNIENLVINGADGIDQFFERLEAFFGAGQLQRLRTV